MIDRVGGRAPRGEPNATAPRCDALPPKNETAPGFAFKVSPAREDTLLAAAVAMVLAGYRISGRTMERRCPPRDVTTINRFDRGAVRLTDALCDCPGLLRSHRKP